MQELKFHSTGSDASYLSNVNVFLSTLFNSDIFKGTWPEEKLGSQSELQKSSDWFRQMYEGGLTGNRMQIAARKTARQDLDLRIQKILYYLVVMADQNDIALLLNSGVVSAKTRKKTRRSVKPAVASAN